MTFLPGWTLISPLPTSASSLYGLHWPIFCRLTMSIDKNSCLKQLSIWKTRRLWLPSGATSNTSGMIHLQLALAASMARINHVISFMFTSTPALMSCAPYLPLRSKSCNLLAGLKKMLLFGPPSERAA